MFRYKGTNNNDTNSRDLKQHVDNNIGFVPCHNTSTMLGLPQNAYNDNDNNNNVASNPTENFMARELQRLARMKDEFSSSESYPKFSDMINSSPTSSIEDLHLNPSPRYNNNQELLLRTFSNGCQIKNGQLVDQFPDDTSNNHYHNSSSRTRSRGTFSQIFPTINISNLNQSPSGAICSNSFDMNLPALDLFGSPRFNGNFSHPSSFSIPHHQLGSFFKDTCLSYGLDQMHQPNHTPVICHGKVSFFLFILFVSFIIYPFNFI